MGGVVFGLERRRVERKEHGEMSRVLRYLRRAKGRAELHPPGIVREQAWAWKSGGSAILRSYGRSRSLLFQSLTQEKRVRVESLPICSHFFFSSTFLK